MKPDDLERRLAAYEELLRSWSRRIDLVARADLDRLRERHLDDSLKALPLVTAAAPGACIDVGSGGGLPGIPLALASGRPWRLLEPRRRRAAFLDECLRVLELHDCEVVRMSASQAAAGRLAGAHLVATARALAPPAEAAALCLPLVAVGGAVAIFVGESAEIPPDAEEAAPGLITIRKG
ncbi:MAG TPA: RsmG family class I SAM-dependent methyltransferase [Actinomycetota bacterium]|nr:RsmG family class I SAM-dependent methyltransferase [Actinomycetota bacterium]